MPRKSDADLARRAIGDIVSRVTAKYPGREAEILVTLVLQVLDQALYGDQDAAPAFAAALNKRLIEMAEARGVAVPWALAQIERGTKH